MYKKYFVICLNWASNTSKDAEFQCKSNANSLVGMITITT